MDADECVENSPFFGSKPDSLALIRVGLNLAVTSNKALGALGELWSDCRSVAQSDVIPLRWWIGAAPPFFEKQNLVTCPRELKNPLFNGDESYRVSKEEGDIVVTLGGEWEQVLVASENLIASIAERGHQIMGIDFGYDSGTDRGHTGFVDGTSNLQELPRDDFRECIFLQPEDDADFVGGTYLVFRKYEENVELWEDLPESVQEQMIGRKKVSGAFLNGKFTWSRDVWDRTHLAAHIRLSHKRATPQFWYERIYRRSMKFTERSFDGIRCGLLFLALCRSPQRQVVRIHNERLLPNTGRHDLLLSSGYIKPLFSATYFLPRAQPQLSEPKNKRYAR